MAKKIKGKKAAVEAAEDSSRSMLAPYIRSATYDLSKVDKEKRTVPVAFSSETAVRCREYNEDTDDFDDFDEVLDHDPENIDMGRASGGLPLMLSHRDHDAREQVGIVEGVTIDADKVGRGLARFSENPDADAIFKDVVAGIRKGVSVGYDRTRLLSTDTATDGRQIRRYAWNPLSISVVPVPADTRAGWGRSKKHSKRGWGDEVAVQSCYTAISTARQTLKEIEACESKDDSKHQAAITELKDAIVACLNVAGDASSWGENTAAQNVALCESTAEACTEASDAAQKLASCVHCAASALEVVEELDEATEKCLANAGKSPNQTEGQRNMKLNIRLDPAPANAPGGGPAVPSSPTADQIKVIEGDVITRERNRVTHIRSSVDTMCQTMPAASEAFRSLESKAISEGQSTEDFNLAMLKAIPGARKANEITAASLGMSEDEIKAYSYGRAIKSAAKTRSFGGIPEGLEGEVHRALAAKVGDLKFQGFLTPFEMGVSMRSSRGAQRDLAVGTFGAGGAFVPTKMVLPIIEILRNKMCFERLGVQTLAGLDGNIVIPRQTGAATAFSLPELSTLTQSNQVLDQVPLSPKRVGVTGDFSSQLVLQSSVDVENFVRDDNMKQLALAIDRLIGFGSGAASEPLGIANTNGIGAVTFGGAASWANVLAFETALALANADSGDMAYITTPGVRGKWKAAPKVAASTFPIFLWEKGPWDDGSNDGEVNGYRAAATNQVPSDRVLFGNWSDAVVGMWGGFNTIVDPFTRAKDDVIRIVTNIYLDLACRHQGSFALSSDSGAQ